MPPPQSPRCCPYKSTAAVAPALFPMAPPPPSPPSLALLSSSSSGEPAAEHQPLPHLGHAPELRHANEAPVTSATATSRGLTATTTTAKPHREHVAPASSSPSRATAAPPPHLVATTPPKPTAPCLCPVAPAHLHRELLPARAPEPLAAPSFVPSSPRSPGARDATPPRARDDGARAPRPRHHPAHPRPPSHASTSTSSRSSARCRATPTHDIAQGPRRRAAAKPRRRPHHGHCRATTTPSSATLVATPQPLGDLDPDPDAGLRHLAMLPAASPPSPEPWPRTSLSRGPPRNASSSRFRLDAELPVALRHRIELLSMSSPSQTPGEPRQDQSFPLPVLI